jgi:nucleotide-binding universal stress UspA family protein/mannose-6-phosphate isomerase-like protein (cupin superfamily)
MSAQPDPYAPLTFRRILVPLDGSRLAEIVLPVTFALAAKLGATVTLLHVLERDAPDTVHGERHLRDTAEAERYLHAIAEQWSATGVRVDLHVHPNPENDVAGSIAQHAAELGADLIALATHGSGGLRRLLFGRIAEQVLRRGGQPVLLMRPQPDASQPSSFDCRVILVPLDGTPDAERAIPAARALARATGAELHLVRVVPTVSTVRGPASAAATFTPTATAALLDAEQQSAHEYLLAIGRRLAADSNVAVQVRRGDVADELAKAVEELGADLIVLSTHARGGIESFLTGSIAAELLGRLDRPVVLVRREDGASDAPALGAVSSPRAAFQTRQLPDTYDVLAPDGSEIRLLCATERGSMAHGRLPPGRVSLAIRHRTVEEIWYITAGRGQVWRKLGEHEQVVDVRPGTSLSIPVGTHFQFRATADAPLEFIMCTMPPWPGPNEAERVADYWEVESG